MEVDALFLDTFLLSLCLLLTMEKLQLRWPEEVVTTTTEVSVLAQQLADLSTMLAGLNKFTISLLKSCYGEQWKQRYPSFKYGKNKQELFLEMPPSHYDKGRRHWKD
ncbi:hypothetical protein QOT17_023849 [Balamuthia mandrillaris]